MKNLLIISFIFISLALSAENYYYDDGAWKKVSDNTAGIPPSSSTRGNNYEIRDNGYTVDSYAIVKNFVILNGFKVVLNHTLNVTGKFDLQGSGYVVGVDIGSSGELVLDNGGETPIIGRPINYLATSSKAIISAPPSSEDFGRINPISSSKGQLVFNSIYEEYNVGSITITSDVKYSFGQPNITIIGGLTFEYNTRISQDNITIKGSVVISSGSTLSLEGTGFAVEESLTTIEANSVLNIY